ncbi:TRAP-type C4-dicarboxylate transport system substrate-binding protein [Maritalea mobilis]|jgi:TRAP-type C4-dicarboxylate transport system substrate-binding protein|uniref:TRAP-type C4-dicarboxylate transport system substrate-binding protein n=1 Tax=Maritalea mobilis TaxID=483324 RepID=A0A4R6VPE9_9HYPH|nr:C4-dicarboxylate TRAP transporter substrate-binding protein [Maritalea mobilis]TDQ64142.1 TRAP-type C4-dicarboxylate transport system substrate-binding protein [Maritalea mobilis]
MKTITKTAIAALLGMSFVGEAVAVEWNVSLWGQRRAFTEHVEKLAELVSAKTNGEFTLNLSYGGLSNNRENLDGISIGAFEMAQFCAGYHADKNPSITVLELPFLGVTSLEQEIAASMAVYNHPATQADLGRWNATLLMPSPLPQYNFVGVGEAPRSLDDFEGLTVRATGGIGRAMESIGAVPNSMSATEVRQALDSGVVKAVSFAPHAHMSFGTIESGEWWTTNMNPGTVNCPVVANTDALNSLSDAHREALLSSIPESLQYYVDFYNNQTMAAWGPALDERGIERITYTDEELDNFRSAAGDIAKNWVEENNAKGLPAQELLDLVNSTLAN